MDSSRRGDCRLRAGRWHAPGPARRAPRSRRTTQQGLGMRRQIFADTSTGGAGAGVSECGRGRCGQPSPAGAPDPAPPTPPPDFLAAGRAQRGAQRASTPAGSQCPPDPLLVLRPVDAPQMRPRRAACDQPGVRPPAPRQWVASAAATGPPSFLKFISPDAGIQSNWRADARERTPSPPGN
jgi:hypothetical protein